MKKLQVTQAASLLGILFQIAHCYNNAVIEHLFTRFLRVLVKNTLIVKKSEI